MSTGFRGSVTAEINADQKFVEIGNCSTVNFSVGKQHKGRLAWWNWVITKLNALPRNADFYSFVFTRVRQ